MAEHLLTAWPDVVRAVTPSTRLALFIDFDGTLAPIQRSPKTVRPSAGVRRALSALVDHGHLVGIVSGRTLRDVEARVGVRRAWYVGDQGFLLKTPDAHTVLLARPSQQARIARAARALRQSLNGAPGVWIEEKIATLTVHYRGASAPSRLAARHAAFEVITPSSGLRVMAGKQIWEVVPAAPVDKAHAVGFILRLARAHAHRHRWLRVYIGDDVADEQVFKVWRGVSVAVGRRHRTAARYYVRTPGEVREVLEALVEIFEGPSTTSTNARRTLDY